MSGFKPVYAKVVAVAVGLTAFFGWLANFAIPADQLQFLVYALKKMWPELLVVALLVAAGVQRQALRDAARAGLARARRIDAGSGGLARKVALVSVAVALLASLGWIAAIGTQVGEAFERRSRMYAYALSGNYVRYLHDEAVAKFGAGEPDAAATVLQRAADWPLATSAEKVRYARYVELAKTRAGTAAEFFAVHEAQPVITSATGNGYLAGAVLLDSATLTYRDAAMRRTDALVALRDRLAPVFIACGSGGGRRPAGEEKACRVLMAQVDGVDAPTCAAAAARYCRVFGVDALSAQARREHFVSMFHRTSGMNPLASAVGIAQAD